MTAVNNGIQDAYEKKVLNEFYNAFDVLRDHDKAFHDAVLYARGIYDGGALVGYKYDFDKAYKKLSTSYGYSKGWR